MPFVDFAELKTRVSIEQTVQMLGLNLMLQALPLDGKIVLRPPKDSDERPAQNEEPRNTRSQSNNNRGRR